jgi:hypothetical protein
VCCARSSRRVGRKYSPDPILLGDAERQEPVQSFDYACFRKLLDPLNMMMADARLFAERVLISHPKAYAEA